MYELIKIEHPVCGYALIDRHNFDPENMKLYEEPPADEPPAPPAPPEPPVKKSAKPKEPPNDAVEA